jgi:tRNA dimethylallyltransferase
MFQAGLVDEVRGLLAEGAPPNIKAFESIGYKEALSVIHGRLSLPEAIENTIIATRQYAKRQTTWFRRVPGAVLLPGFGDSPSIIQLARQAILGHQNLQLVL